MTDARQFRHETDTEVIPSVSSGEGLARTEELPAVEDATVEMTSAEERTSGSGVTALPEPSREQARPASAVQSPTVVVEPAPVVSPSQPPPAVAAPSPAAPVPSPASVAFPSEPPPAVPASPTGTGGDSFFWRNAFLALIAALVIGVVAGLIVLRERGDLSAVGLGGGSAAATVTVPASISSLDPSGGSGFRSAGAGTWRTQTYQSATFGNLKSGVGLLLDVGAPRAVGAVTFEVVGGPVAVELRAGDERAGSEAGYARITGTSAASGPTTFTVKGGAKHRYWLIWVTRLAAQDGGYRAVIRQPTVKGS